MNEVEDLKAEVEKWKRAAGGAAVVLEPLWSIYHDKDTFAPVMLDGIKDAVLAIRDAAGIEKREPFQSWDYYAYKEYMRTEEQK